MSEPIKIGVAGAGVFGGYHAQKYAGLDGCEIAGVYDVDHDRAKSLADRFNTTAFAAFDDLTALTDAVVIATPANTHFKLAKQALEAGRDVFVEKPLAETPEEAAALVALAEKKSRILQVGYQERYVADACGLFNAPQSKTIECVRQSKPSERCRDVSVVLDLMIHDLDIVQHLTGARRLEVTSAIGDWNEIQVKGILDTGQNALFTSDRSSSSMTRTVSLRNDDEERTFDFGTKQFIEGGVSKSRLASSAAEVDDPLEFGAACFLKAVKDRTQPVICGRDAVISIQWASQIEAAAGINSKSDLELEQV